jgi:hypothetical protein
MSLKSKLIVGLLMFLMLLATVSAIRAWYIERNKPPVSQIEYVKVPEIKEVIKVKRVEVPGPERIVTVEKIKIVEKLKLPEWFATNTDEQAIATGEVQPYEGKTNVVATLNTKTGVGGIIAKQEPLSFVGFSNDKELYAKAGYSTNTELQVTIGAEWRFVRIGKIKVGVFGEGRAYFKNTSDRQNTEAIGGVVLTY